MDVISTMRRKENTMDNKLSAPSRTMHWVDRNKIKPNDYNPNKVSRQNLELLTQSQPQRRVPSDCLAKTQVSAKARADV